MPKYFREYDWKHEPHDVREEEVSLKFSVPGSQKICTSLRLRTENFFQSKSKSRIGRPVSGVSLAFFTASWNFFSSNSEACFLRLHRLAEDRVATVVLLFHGARCFFHVVEGFRFDRGGVRDDAPGSGVDFHDRAAAGAGHIEIGFRFRTPR